MLLLSNETVKNAYYDIISAAATGEGQRVAVSNVQLYEKEKGGTQKIIMGSSSMGKMNRSCS
jgi:hypothetical protein